MCIRDRGNLIKLPLGIHRRTGYRSLFLDDDGRPLEDQLGVLRDVPKLERPDLFRIADALKATVVAVAAETPEPPDERQDEPAGQQQDTQAPAPPELPPAWTEADFETDPQVAHLFHNCPVLAELKRQVEEHRQLMHDEQLVLVHTLGHLPAGPQAVNYLLRKCLDVAPDQLLKSPLRGNPMSCAKIRKRIGHVTRRVPCNCDFSFAPNHYPTPTLHLLTLPPDARRPEAAQPPADAESIARRFGVLQRRREEIEREWQQLHDRLCSILRMLPDRTLVLPEGRYRLIEREGVEELVWEENTESRPDHPEPVPDSAAASEASQPDAVARHPQSDADSSGPGDGSGRTPPS